MRNSENTKIGDLIGTSERLGVTFQQCVTGDAEITIVAICRINQSTVCRIKAGTGEAIWTVLMREGSLAGPSSEEERKEISQSFENKWNFCHAVGALDAKHIIMHEPHNARSGYLNYRRTHSMVFSYFVMQMVFSCFVTQRLYFSLYQRFREI